MERKQSIHTHKIPFLVRMEERLNMRAWKTNTDTDEVIIYNYSQGIGIFIRENEVNMFGFEGEGLDVFVRIDLNGKTHEFTAEPVYDCEEGTLKTRYFLTSTSPETSRDFISAFCNHSEVFVDGTEFSTENFINCMDELYYVE